MNLIPDDARRDHFRRIYVMHVQRIASVHDHDFHEDHNNTHNHHNHHHHDEDDNNTNNNTYHNNQENNGFTVLIVMETVQGFLHHLP